MRCKPYARSSQAPHQGSAGFSLIEVMIAVLLTAILAASLGHVIGSAFDVHDEVRARSDANRQGLFVIGRMQRAVHGASQLIVPQAERPGTAHSESVRDPGVLAVTLDPSIDRDADGISDSDNDGDGRIDEDLPGDANNDDEAGIRGVDDDNDGLVDESNSDDDDEDEDTTGNKDEDWLDGVDNDGDGAVDEDPPDDANNDGEAGIRGVDDDNDGLVDESNDDDDDEDEDTTGNKDEDWLDVVVFRLVGSQLLERVPVPWDENSSGSVTGQDFIEQPIAENIATFIVSRSPAPNGGQPVVEITLGVTMPSGEISTHTVKFLVGSGQ